ncbi:kinase-like domain-containing protein [Mycena epipterygia]|nr:kinase-like domain-containing protein [Mycena epipterygia]
MQDIEPPQPFLWGYLEPLVPGPHVQRLDLYDNTPARGVLFGRSRGSTHVLGGAGVSQCHATIRWNGRKDLMSIVTITNHSKTNGTFVDGVKVEGINVTQLFEGCTVFFGSKVPVVSEQTDFRYIFHHPYGRSKSDTVFNHYTMCDQIGAGSFGTVYRATEKKSGKLFAVKTACKNAKQEDAVTCASQETMALMNLKHPHICALHQVFFRMDGLVIDIVLEYIDGIRLFDLISEGPITEDQGREISFQLCDAVAYMHHQGVSHGDLKLDNVLIMPAEHPIIKVIDFGLARVADSYNINPVVTGGLSTAPEAASQLTQFHTRKLDVTVTMSRMWDGWGVGAIIFSLLTGGELYLFDCEKPHTFRPGVDRIRWHGMVSKSDPARDFVRSFLVADPAHRMTVEESLEHPWLAGHIPYQLSFASVSFLRSPSPDDEFEVAQDQSEMADDEHLAMTDIDSDSPVGHKGGGRRRPQQRVIFETPGAGVLPNRYDPDEARAQAPLRASVKAGPSRLDGRPRRTPARR